MAETLGVFFGHLTFAYIEGVVSVIDVDPAGIVIELHLDDADELAPA